MKGIEFDALGTRHCLRFDFNALCQIEADFDNTPVAEVMAQMSNRQGRPPLMRDIRRVFRAGLGPDVTEEQAGDVIAALGIEPAMGLMERALLLAFPEAAQGKAPPSAGKAKRRA
jgi:hypothetical protein